MSGRLKSYLSAAFVSAYIILGCAVLVFGLGGPASTVDDPKDGALMPASLGSFSIKGTVTDASASDIKNVEVYVDGKELKTPVNITRVSHTQFKWKCTWAPLPLGNHSITSRATNVRGEKGEPSPVVKVDVL